MACHSGTARGQGQPEHARKACLTENAPKPRAPAGVAEPGHACKLLHPGGTRTKRAVSGSATQKQPRARGHPEHARVACQRRPHPKPPAPAGWRSQARPVNSSTRAAGQGPPPKPGNACKLRPADGERGGSLGPNIHHMMDVEKRQARARTSITQMDAVAPRSQAMPATPAETSNKHD